MAPIVLRIFFCNYGLSSRVSSSSLQTQNPPRCFLNGRSLSKKTSTFDDCPMVALLTNPSKFVRPWSNQRKTVPLRPWLHMLSIQSKITEKDRDKFNWNSAGVVRKTIRKVKGRKDHVNVSLAKIEHHRCAMFPCHCKQYLTFWTNLLPRSGGPRLTKTGEYPDKFCRQVAAYHKKWCIESCLT